jgi:hypothetical protein
MEKLRDDLLILKDLDETLKNSFKSLSFEKENEMEIFLEQVDKIVQIKKEIAKNEFSKSSIFILDNEDAKCMLQKISSGQLLFADRVVKALEQITKTKFDLETSDWDELSEIASNELFPWFGPAEYIARLIEIGGLVLDITIPKELELIVEETRRCYGFEQYIAVHSLCRTILEISMRDICFRIEKKFPKKLAPFVSNGDSELKKRINKLYSRLSIVIHGNKLSDSNGAQSVFRETLMMVQELYQKNQSRFL